MPASVPPAKWKQYIEYRKKRGLTMPEACRTTGISYETAKRFESGDPRSSGHKFYPAFKAEGETSRGLPMEPIPIIDLGEEAQRALNDFAYFRMRYSGLVLSPWQEEANAAFDEMYRKDDERRYVVMNMPPESGKTTFMRDKLAQLTARDREIAGLMGSFANNMAWNMMTSVSTMLTRQTPWQAPTKDLLAGASDAESTMWMDFGRFRPEERELRWNRSEIVVMQHDRQMLAGKEATWTSYGRESRLNLGSRFDFIVWDDLVTMKSVGTVDARESLFQWWDTEGETRLNMGGLLVLLGQRISSTDLYRHALDKMDFEEGEHLDFVPTGKKYVHLCYQGHDDEHCKGDDFHRKDSPAWRPDGTGGCVLEPRRVGYRHMMTIKSNNPEHFATQYQQKDGDPANVLIPQVWLDGGRDEDGSMLPGCWDRDRDFWQVPAGLSRPMGVITVDPSPTKWWGIQAWVYVPSEVQTKREDGTAGGLRYLVAMLNHSMDAPSFLEYHPATRKYTGVLDEWYENFLHMGVPLRYVIFEEAAAQRWALQYEIIKNWYRDHNVRVIGHKTHGYNKPDPTLGIPMLKPAYREGRVRLPRKAYQSMKDMLYQLTNYNQSYRGPTDQVMANWFLESNLPNIVRNPTETEPPRSSFGRLVVVERVDAKALLAR